MRYSAEYLDEKAKELRQLCMRLSHAAGAEGAHVGPALSIADIMAVLYFDVMDYRPDQPHWEDRDRFLLSKGHAVLGLYAPLILSGYISGQMGNTFNQAHTRLAGHPSGKGVPGIEHPSGSLGHGLSVGCGMAFAAKMDQKDYKVYVLIGDGESDEGSIWEAVMFAKHHQLGNLTAIVDVNGLQYGGPTKHLMDLSPMEGKWAAFGWNVISVEGNDTAALQLALDKSRLNADIPTCVLAHTTKGCGFSLAEGNNEWHHVELSEEDMKCALAELELGGNRDVCN